MKKLEVLEVAVEKKSFVGIKTGRPVNASSKRQQRLAEGNAKIEAGVTIQRGRPVSSDSERQKRIAELETKRANGELKLGRAVNPLSKRQLRIAELEAKRVNGEIRRGRPKKQSDDISLIGMLKTVHK
jgi:hypothetical protein